MGFDIPMRTKGALDRNSLIQNYGVQGDTAGAPPQGLPGGQPNNGYNSQGQNNYNNQPNNGFNSQGQNNYNNQPNNGYTYQPIQSPNNGGFLNNIDNQLNGFASQLDNSFNDIFSQNNDRNYTPPQVGDRSADTLGQSVSSGGVYSSRGGQAQGNMQNNMPNNAVPPNRGMPNNNNAVSGGMYQSNGINNGSAQCQPAQPVKPRIKRQRLSRTGTPLAKGQKVQMKNKKGASLSRIKICFGWEPMRDNIELDASAFMLGSSGKVISDDWFIFYGQPESPDGSVKYQVFSDDPRSPDDAAVEIDLSKVSPEVQKIVLAVTMYEASQRRQNFSMVADLYARITDASNAQEVMRFEMKEGYATVTAMVLGELYRHNNEWKFNSVGSGVNRDLADFCGMYGVALE